MAADWGDEGPSLTRALAQRVFCYFVPYWRRVILVFDNGRLIERGRHAELVQVEGLYAQLYQRQFLSGDERRLDAADLVSAGV
jgi:hypothetical protein